jgi:serine/threonine-protein kinase
VEPERDELEETGLRFLPSILLPDSSLSAASDRTGQGLPARERSERLPTPLAESAPTAGPASPGLPVAGRSIQRRYRLERVIGAGSSGVVMAASQVVTGQSVAIKLLRNTRSGTNRSRFLREAQILKRIRHPNLVRLIDVGCMRGFLCLVVELVAGGSLQDRLRRVSRPPLPEVLSIVIGCLDALATCHASGIVHRDLKPANILLTLDGTAKVADLGLAHWTGAGMALTRTGEIIGTARYMAPEQARGGRPSPAADLYAVGVILYEMLAGQAPFLARGFVEALRMHVRSPVPPLRHAAPEVPEPLERLVHRLLAKSPEDRPATALEVSRQLVELARSAPTAPTAPGRSAASARDILPP